MKINWKSVASLGNNILKTLVPGVGDIETVATTLIKTGKTMTGAEKAAAVKDLVRVSLTSAEYATDKDLLDNAAVDAAAQDVIDAVVNFHKAIANAKGVPAA